jgi:hypothetical protein
MHDEENTENLGGYEKSQPQNPIWDKSWNEVQGRRRFMAISGGVVGSFAIAFGLCCHRATPFSYDDGVRVWQAIVLGVWIIVPPVWFWYEYFYLFKRTKDFKQPQDFERFKYGQEQSAKIWLALVTVLIALYFGPNLLGHEKTSPCTAPQVVQMN